MQGRLDPTLEYLWWQFGFEDDLLLLPVVSRLHFPPIGHTDIVLIDLVVFQALQSRCIFLDDDLHLPDQSIDDS